MFDQEKITSRSSPAGSNQSSAKSDDNLLDVSTSESKLVDDDTKSLKFGKTSMDDKQLDLMVPNRMVERATVCLSENEVVPDPKPHECVVFQDQFTTGLCMPCQDFLEDYESI